MEVLQPILNVLAITGVTGLTLNFYLQKRDNRKLQQACREGQHSAIAPVSVTINPPPPTLAPGAISTLVVNDDIRRYVAKRARDWAALTVPRTIHSRGF